MIFEKSVVLLYQSRLPLSCLFYQQASCISLALITYSGLKIRMCFAQRVEVSSRFCSRYTNAFFHFPRLHGLCTPQHRWLAPLVRTYIPANRVLQVECSHGPHTPRWPFQLCLLANCSVFWSFSASLLCVISTPDVFKHWTCGRTPLWCTGHYRRWPR